MKCFVGLTLFSAFLVLSRAGPIDFNGTIETTDDLLPKPEFEEFPVPPTTNESQPIAPSVTINHDDDHHDDDLTTPTADEEARDSTALVPANALFSEENAESNLDLIHTNIGSQQSPCCQQACAPVPPPQPICQQPCVQPICQQPCAPPPQPICVCSSPCQAVATPSIDKAGIKKSALAAGLLAGKIATAKVSAPIVLLNAKIAAKAAKLPFYWAKKGAVLGTAVALPVKLAAAITSGATVAANGLLVGVPVGIGAGLATAAANLKSQLWSHSQTPTCTSNPCYN